VKLEDTRQFEVGGNVDAGSADISITCLRCPDWHHWIAVATTQDSPAALLADLIERAEGHAETCPGVYRG